jgi:hypothetical protein
MPDSSENASSWPGLVGQINSTFMLVRDVFGYALPGGVFLAIGVIAKSSNHGGFSLDQVWDIVPFPVPAWAVFLVLLAACYAAGSALAAIIYMPVAFFKYAFWMYDRHFASREVTNTTEGELSVGHEKIPGKQTKRVSHRASRNLPAGLKLAHEAELIEGTWRAWLINNPTEVTSKTLEIRVVHPELLNTLDRRETLTVMSGAMAAALLGGYFVFYSWQWTFSQIIWWAGWIVLIQFLTGLAHLRRVLKAVHAANPQDSGKPPDFPRLTSQFMEALTAYFNKKAN